MTSHPRYMHVWLHPKVRLLNVQPICIFGRRLFCVRLVSCSCVCHRMYSTFAVSNLLVNNFLSIYCVLLTVLQGVGGDVGGGKQPCSDRSFI